MSILLTFWREKEAPTLSRFPNVLAVREELKHYLSRGQLVAEGSFYLKHKRAGVLTVELTGCTAAEVLKK